MKSLIINPAHNFELVEHEKPVAAGKYTVIKTKYAAICGTDNMLWNVMPGLSPGHEFSGYVEDPGSLPLKKGARVCAPAFNPCCSCELCREGKENLCAQVTVDNAGCSVGMDGGFSEYVSVRSEFVHEIPDDVPLELGAIVEPMAIALHAVRRSDIQPGESVLVWGDGPIAVYAAAWAKLVGGAGKVFMVGFHQSRTDRCKSFSFVDDCVSVKEDGYVEKIKSWMPENGFPAVFDGVGFENYDELMGFVKPGRTLVIIGMHAQRLSFDMYTLMFRQINVHPSMYFTNEDFGDALRLAGENQDIFLPTITGYFPQDPQAAQNVFTKLFESSDNDDCKVLLKYED